jgi:hypothetical protein
MAKLVHPDRHMKAAKNQALIWEQGIKQTCESLFTAVRQTLQYLKEQSKYDSLLNKYVNLIDEIDQTYKNHIKNLHGIFQKQIKELEEVFEEFKERYEKEHNQQLVRLKKFCQETQQDRKEKMEEENMHQKNRDYPKYKTVQEQHQFEQRFFFYWEFGHVTQLIKQQHQAHKKKNSSKEFLLTQVGKETSALEKKLHAAYQQFREATWNSRRGDYSFVKYKNETMDANEFLTQFRKLNTQEQREHFIDKGDFYYPLLCYWFETSKELIIQDLDYLARSQARWLSLKKNWLLSECCLSLETFRIAPDLKQKAKKWYQKEISRDQMEKKIEKGQIIKPFFMELYPDGHFKGKNFLNILNKKFSEIFNNFESSTHTSTKNSETSSKDKRVMQLSQQSVCRVSIFSNNNNIQKQTMPTSQVIKTERLTI